MDVAPPMLPTSSSQPSTTGDPADGGTGGGRDESREPGPKIVQDGGGDALDVPLLLKNCHATDAVDVFSLGFRSGAEARGKGDDKRVKPTVAASDGLR